MSKFEKDINKGRFVLDSKVDLKMGVIKSVSWSKGLCVIGCKNGSINILDQDFNVLQQFKISEHSIDAIAFDGNWVGLGMRSNG